MLAAVSVRIRVFGPVTVEGAPPLAPRDRRVLAALVVDAGRICPADRLADALYGDALPPTWRKVVQGSVGRLRHALGPHAIATVADGYRLELGDSELDTRRFERLVADAADLSTAGEHERAALTLQTALALVSPDPLPDLDGWEPGVAAAARYDELRRLAEEGVVRAQLASGQNERALAAATGLVVREPLREYRWVALALAQYRSGRQGEALRSIARARRTLADELGLDPCPDLVALERAILAQDADLVGPAASAWTGIGRCPYRGLAAYDVADADWFFGRDQEVAECLAIMAHTGFVAVVGASGSGKSSLARAGVAAALCRDGREVATVTPGHQPDAVLAAVAPGCVLIVDQLEEMFSRCSDRDARARFAAAIGAWSETAPVVTTLRADHLADVAELPELAAHVQAGLFLLGAMGEPQLRAAIEVPARKVGLRLEPGLVDLLVRDVLGEPGALPLLSHALTQTWEQREGPVLTSAGYRAVGGVHGAVARAADAAIDSMSPEGQRVARDLLLRLVMAGDGTQPMRRQLPRAALGTDATTQAVLDALVRSRLVIADADTVEVAHEAVFRAWPRLRAWLDEDRDGIRVARHLSTSATEWDQSGRELSELYRGPRLIAALDWSEREDTDLNEVEQAFVAASVAHRDAAQQDMLMQVRRQTVVNRRLRTLLVAVGCLLLAALIAGVLAWRQTDRARQAEATADSASYDAETRRLLAAAEALAADNPPVARLLAVEASQRRDADPDDVRTTLQRVLTTVPGYLGSFPAAGIPEFVGDDGLVVRTATGLRGYDVSSHELTGAYDHPRRRTTPGRMTGVLGGTIVESAGDRQLHVLRWPDLQPARAVVETAADIDAIAAAAGLVSTGHADGSLIVWDGTTFEERWRSTATAPIRRLAMSADGSTVAALTAAGELIIFDATSGDRHLLDVPTTNPTDIAVAADGSQVAIVDATTATTSIVEVRTGETVELAVPGGVYTRFVAADRLAVSTATSTVIVAISGDQPQRHVDVACGCDLAVSRDGTKVTLGTSQQELYSLDGGELLAQPITSVEGAGTSVTLGASTDGRYVSIADSTGFRVFDLSSGSPTAVLDRPPPAWGLVQPDRTVVILERGGRRVAVHDHADARNERSISIRAGTPTTALVSPDGQHLAVTLENADIAVVATDSGRLVARLSELAQANSAMSGDPTVAGLAFRPDGAYLAGTTTRGASVVWDTTDWQAAATPTPSRSDVQEAPRPAFDPTGRLLAVSDGADVQLLDASTFQAAGRLQLHEGGPPRELAFSADGAQLAVVGGRRIVIFDIDSGRQVGAALPTSAASIALTGSPPAVTAVNGAWVVRWALELDHLASIACSSAGRNLTRAEWEGIGPQDSTYNTTCHIFGPPQIDPAPWIPPRTAIATEQQG